MANVNERTPETSPTIWAVLAADLAAGYAADALGDWRLIGLVTYGPTTEVLRGIRLRELELLTDLEPGLTRMRQEHPPTRERLAAAWAEHEYLQDHAVTTEYFQTWTDLQATELEHFTSSDQLTRREGEDPNAFYARVSRAHMLLTLVTDRPIVELAKRAGVPHGTAAAWVSRARTKGIYEQVENGSI